MTIVTIAPHSIVIDDSFAPPTADQLAGSGVSGEVRYASTPDSNPKNWTRAQLAERHRLGVASLMIHEQTAQDHHGGAAAGRAKADVFARYADLVGYPREAPALVACDTSPSQLIVDYCGAFHERIRALGWKLTGAYIFGPVAVQMLLDAGVCTDVLWQAYAGSAIFQGSLADNMRIAEQRYGHLDVTIEVPPGYVVDASGKVVPRFQNTVQVVHRKAHAFQRYGYAALFGGPFREGQVDENIVLRPLPMWLPSGAPQPAPGPIFPIPNPVPPTPQNPQTEETDMAARLVTFSYNRDDIYLAHNFNPANNTCSLVTAADMDTYTRWLPFGEPYATEDGAEGSVVCLGPAGAGARFKAVLDAGQGPKGDKGDKGPKGDTGATGPKGEPGVPGPSLDAVLAEAAVRLTKK